MHRSVEFERLLRERGPALSRTAYLLTGDHAAGEALLRRALDRTAQRWRSTLDTDDPEATVRGFLLDLALAGPPARGEGGPGLGPALAALPPTDRVLLFLRYAEGGSPADAAPVLGAGLDTVERLTREALSRLRERAPDLVNALDPRWVDAAAAPLRAAYRDQELPPRAYVEPEPVIAAQHARERRTRLVVGGVAAVVAVAVLAWLVFGTGGADQPVAGRASGTPAPAASATGDRLPLDSAIAPLTLALRDCAAGCPTRVVAQDGRRYTLPEAGQGAAFASVTISPTGRAVAFAREGSLVLVWTEFGRTQRLARTLRPLAWSTDSGHLLLSGDGSYTVIETRTGGRIDFPATRLGGQVPVGVSQGGFPIVAEPGTGDRTRVEFAVLRPGDGSVESRTVVAAASHLRPGEVLADPARPGAVSWYGARDNQLLFLQVVDAAGAPTGLLRVHRDGNVLNRFDPPAAGGPWRLLGPLDGAAAVAGGAAGAPVTVARVEDGRAVPVAELPAGAEFRLPGAVAS